jgi:MFS family permease
MIEMSHPQSEQAMLPGPSTGRQARSVAAYSFLTALMIVTPMLVFVPAALFHCALRNGRRAAWVAGLLALSLAAAYAVLVPAPADLVKLSWANIAGIGMAVIVPSLFALPLVQRGEKFGTLVAYLVAGGTAGLVFTELASRTLWHFSPLAFHIAQAQKSNTDVVAFYRQNNASPEMLSMMERWSSYSTVVLPSFMLIMLSLVFILSLLMLGRLRAFRPLAQSASQSVTQSASQSASQSTVQTVRQSEGQMPGVYLFRHFALPDWVLFVFVIGGLTPVASGLLQKIAANALVVALFLFIMQGVAIFRFALLAMGAGFGGTMLGWLLLLILTFSGGAGLLLLAVAGLFDPFFNFRHSKKRKDDSHESHSD